MAKVSLHILACFFLLSVPAAAQNIEWSNQQKVKSKSYYTQILGETGSGIFLVRSKANDFSKDLTLERYKHNLSMDLSKELPQADNAYLEKMVLQDNGIMAFSSRKNSQDGKIELFCWRIDENLNALSQNTELLSVNSAEFRDNSSFYIKSSADKSKSIVVYLTSNPADKNASVLHLHTYNESMAAITKKEFPLSYAVSDVFITAVEVDNEGNGFTLIDFPRSKEKKSKDKEVRNFYLYGYYAAEEKMLEYELGKDSLYVNELGMVINNYDKSVSVAGFYSYTKDDTKCNGHFFYLVDIGTTMVRIKSFEDFDKGFVNKVAASMQNESSPVITDLFIRRIIPRSDGGCMIIAEKYYESRQTYTYYVNGFPQTSSRTIYNFDEVVVIGKNADGTTQFRDFVKKKQSSVSDAGYYSSFVLLNANDRVSMIYNSDTNEEGDVMISSITPKGEVDTKILIKSLSYYVTLMPPESKQVASNAVLISTLKDKRFSLLRVTY